jgi:hypothetical protein
MSALLERDAELAALAALAAEAAAGTPIPARTAARFIASE